MTRSPFGRRAGLGLAGALLLALATPVVASAAGQGPVVWAHRGGSYVNGVAKYPENTLPAFTAAAKAGFALEFDVVLTKDLVPLVIHDETLDRTTPCTGKVRDHTYADIEANCRTDVLGSPGGPLGKKAKKTKPSVSLPTLAAVLKVAKQHKVLAAPELKEFDQTGGSARVLAKGIKASGIGTKNVVVQSFLPPMLTNIKADLPGVPTSQLTIGEPVAALQVAVDGKDTWVSPQFTAAIDAAYVTKAHGSGLKVAPYTLDTAAEVKRAKTLKVDALITDDPYMARKTLGQKAPKR
jgi:glycerophosphoryl diester phosphodiesterase